MAKLIGTGPNQVPSNADLGDLAYQNKDNAEIKRLLVENGIQNLSFAEIDSTIRDGDYKGAYIYDTRKDTDGGAWRYKSKQTSWYREPLGSKGRYGKAEFPQIALFLWSAGSIKIYSLDDGKCVQWHDSDQGSNGFDYGFSGDGARIAAANGRIFVSQNQTSGSGYKGIRVVDMILDEFFWTWNQRYSAQYTANTVIDATVVNNLNDVPWFDFYLPSNVVNDVSCVVLDGTPINPDRGLPDPTVAFSTSGGVVVVYGHDYSKRWKSSDHSYGTGCRIKLRQDGTLFASHNGPTSGQMIEAIDVWSLKRLNTRSVNLNSSPFHGYNSRAEHDRVYANGNSWDYADNMPEAIPAYGEALDVEAWDGHVAVHNGTGVMGSPKTPQHHGVLIVAESEQSPEAGMVATIDDTHNTGWMMPNCSRALMCDNKTESITATELYPDPEFDSGTSTGWTVANGTLSFSNGVATYSASGFSNYVQAEYYFTVEKDKIYTLITDVTGYSGSFSYGYVQANASTCSPLFLSKSWNSGEWFTNSGEYVGSGPIGEYALTFKARKDGTLKFAMRIYQSGSLSLGSLSLREGEWDKSNYGKAIVGGAQYRGSLTKSAVADGAELQAFSGFSDDNFIYLPDNNSYGGFSQIGTGDFSTSIWYKTTSSTSQQIWRMFGGGRQILGLWVQTSGQGLFVYNGGSALSTGATATDNDGTWHHVVVQRFEGTLQIYQDGKLVGQRSDETDDFNATGKSNFWIGRSDGTSQYFQGSLALFKFAKGRAMSRDQINKMYHEERRLFRKNAKMSVVGANEDNNTLGMSYDDTEGVLYVATRDGVSGISGVEVVERNETPVKSFIEANAGTVVWG